MKRIETSDDRGFDEPRVMRDEATPDMRAAYHAALTLVSRLERECRAADAALEVLGIENDGSSVASRIERLEAVRRRAERETAEAETTQRYEDSAEDDWQAQRERPAERLDDVSTDECDPRDAVNERIAKLPREQRHEAMRRASCSYSAPHSAVRDGARIEGNEVVWPDGERYPMAPWHAAKGEP